MANFIGIAGDFQKEKAITRRLNAVLTFFIVFTVAVFIMGWISGFARGGRQPEASVA